MAIDFKPSANIDFRVKKKPSVTDFKPLNRIYFQKEKKLSIIEGIKKHPVRSIFQPISKTITGKSILERAKPLERKRQQLLEESLKRDKPMGTAEFVTRTIPAGIKDIGAELVDLSPFDIAAMITTGGVGKLLGKIPISGTTLGKVVKTIPVKKGFGKSVKELGRLDKALKALPETTAISRAPLQFVKKTDAVQKIITAVKGAKPIRKAQEALFTAERAKRAGVISAIGKRTPGERGFYEQLGALKGKLGKVEFEGIRGKVSQLDIDSLFNMVERSALSPFEKITTKNGLSKILGQGGGKVPTEGELGLLKQVFPNEFISAVLKKTPLSKKIGKGIAEVLNIPRAFMTSADMSAPLRQGVFLIGRPKQFLPAFRDMFKHFFSEKSYTGLIKEIKSRPTYSLMKDSKLPITDISNTLTMREEAFMSTLAEKIPGIGKIVRASNRAYTGFLNKLRADVFDNLVRTAEKQGIKAEGKFLNDLSSFIGSATGRGGLGVFERSAVALNSALFSPRLMASRLNLLNPVFYVKLDPFVRKEALKSLFTFSGTAVTVMTLAKLGGAEVGLDPRNADFLKIKFGNTRYDVLGGFQQYMRLATQFITGEHISSTTGVKTTVGEGYKPLTRMDILTRGIETKAAPILSFAIGLLKGKNFLGKDFDVPEEIGKRFVPMVAQDMVDLYQEKGIEGLGMASPAIFGVGVQTYSPDASQMVYSANSVLSHYKEFLKQGNIEEAKKLLENNREIIRVGKKLEPMQKVINSYEVLKRNAEKNVRLTPEERKKRINRYDKRIEELQTKMDKRYELIKTQAKEKSKIDFQLRTTP